MEIKPLKESEAEEFDTSIGSYDSEEEETKSETDYTNLLNDLDDSIQNKVIYIYIFLKK